MVVSKVGGGGGGGVGGEGARADSESRSARMQSNGWWIWRRRAERGREGSGGCTEYELFGVSGMSLECRWKGRGLDEEEVVLVRGGSGWNSRRVA